jgi:enoyl-CoA hydratase
MKAFECIRIDTEAGVSVVTLNRPDRGNAVNDVLHSELSTVFRHLRADEPTRVVVLTGAGHEFCRGGDTNPDRAYQTQTGLTPIQEAREIVESILDLEKPVIAAVNGNAQGVGATLASLADVAFMADDAVLGDAHVQRNLPPGNGPTALWPLLVGLNRAKQLLMEGEMITAGRAAELGLIHAAVNRADVLPAAMSLARRWASGDMFALQATKVAINATAKLILQGVFPLALALEERAMERPEFRQGLAQWQRAQEQKREENPGD